jgi:hypothetical protein
MEERMTNGEQLRAVANDLEIPLRNLADVQASLARAKRRGADEAMATLLLRHGRLTDDAILYIGDNYPTVWE